MVAAFGAAGAVVVMYAAPSAVGVFDSDAGTVALPVRGNTTADLVFAVALAVLAANILYYIYGRRPSEPLEYVLSEAPGGQVKVSRDALEVGLRAAGEGLDEVSRLRIHVEAGGLKRVLVRAHFQSPEGVSILDASQRLRQALVARYDQMVRASDGVRTDFDIEFVGYYGKASRKAEPAVE